VNGHLIFSAAARQTYVEQHGEGDTSMRGKWWYREKSVHGLKVLGL